jgi:hypothetical protein
MNISESSKAEVLDHKVLAEKVIHFDHQPSEAEITSQLEEFADQQLLKHEVTPVEGHWPTIEIDGEVEGIRCVLDGAAYTAEIVQQFDAESGSTALYVELRRYYDYP